MNTLIFDSIFKNEIQDLINLKRAQGFKYVTEEFALKRIDKYLAGKNIQEKVITKSVVDEWCLRKTHETQANQNSRISMMRVLCSYLSELGFDVYVPPKGLTRKAPKYNAHICYEMTIVKWKYHISLIFVFRLLCNFNQGHRTRNFYTDLSAVGHSVMRGLVTSGQWFRRKFLCL